MGKYNNTNKFRRPRNRHHHRKKPLRIKPGSDPRLKHIFSEIGVPEKTPFQPDPFQLDALTAIEKGDCLVSAPTGAGKTWIAEEAIAKVHKGKGRAWYASPLKALTNNVYAKLIDRFNAEDVGILTGDRKENPDAPIIVGTTEILRNHLYDAMHRGDDLETDFVILDEAHFLGDEDRGVVWEEIMIYLPARIPLLMLSATIGNADKISKWLESIRKKKCIIIEEKNRPVPLYPLFFHPSGTLFPLIVNTGKNNKPALYKKVASFIQNSHPPRLAEPGKLPDMGKIIRVLNRYNLLPAIFFMKSRSDCDNALDLCTEDNLLNNPDRKERLSRRIDHLISQSPHLKNHKQLWHLEHLGVGAHHSGHLPAWKVIVETMMAEGLLDAVFATSTVAAGVDFPARTVVILNSDRFNGTAFQALNPTEFHQMTGRSGRRGMDNIGFAMMLPGKFMDLRLVSKLMGSPPSDVFSQIRINFSMVLNLLLSHTPEQIEELLRKSFAAFMISEKQTKKSKGFFIEDTDYLWRDFMQHMNFLKKYDYVTESDTLSADGEWTSKLRIDQPLLVAEGFRHNVFPRKDPALLAAIFASFVEERESDDDSVSRSLVPKKLLTSFLNVKKALRSFSSDMLSSGFSVRPLFLRPAVTIFSWAAGHPWEKVLEISDMAEGDLARLILRTSDNLRHVVNLSDIFPDAAKTADKALDALLREPVVSYLE